MQKQKVKIILTSPEAKIPEYKTPESAGADLYSVNTMGMTLSPGERRLIPTGIKIQMPKGSEAQIRPRSGLSLKEGLSVILGTIDSDYQGEIGVIVHNIDARSHVIYRGERIAQIVFNGIGGLFQAEFEQIDQFEETTERGEGGFGSTGKN